MPSNSVPGFLPSSSGFHFPNQFPDVPVRTIPIPLFGDLPIGSAAGGLCGGMAYAVRDMLEAEVAPPPDANPPAPGSPLFNYLVDRLIESFDIPRGIARYFEWMQFPDDDNWFVRGVVRRTLDDTLPRVRDDIDHGHLSPLGIVVARSINPSDLRFNHQVLSYAYDIGANGDISISLYDPNRPNDDDARMTIAVGGDRPAISYPGGPAVRGFFRSEFVARDIEPVLEA
jgi:hypothetical protein